MASMRRHITPVAHLDSVHVDDETRWDPRDDDERDAPALGVEPDDADDGSDRTRVGDAIPANAEKGDGGAVLRRRPTKKAELPESRRLAKHETQRAENIIRFDGPNDPANAREWPTRKKVFATFLMGMTTMCAQFASSIFSSGSAEIAAEFGVSAEVTVLVTAVFILGYIPGPCIWGPLSEMQGRKVPVLVPFFVFICFTAASATAKDFQTLIITRCFGGVFASAPVTNVGGGIADMFDARARATAVVFYSLAVVGGPTLGPVVGSAVASSYLGWRWTGYVAVILSSAVFVLDLLFLPETYAPALLTRRAVRARLDTGNFALHSKHEEQDFALHIFLEKNVLRPVRLILREPICAAVVVYNSFTYSILYLAFEAFPIQFRDLRGWSPVVSSLPFLALMVGCFVAGAINIAYTQLVYIPLVDRYHPRPVPPEWRLPPMMLGAAIFPAGLFWFGWTSDPSVLWVNQVLATGLIGISFLLIFQAGLNYLLDAYTPVSASVVASNTILRSAFAGGFPMFALPFFGWSIPYAFSILGGVATLLAVVPFIFWRYGPWLRSLSRYAISEDVDEARAAGK